MEPEDLVGLSRALAHALRHDPLAYGIELDEEGWAPLDDLVRGLRGRRRWEDVRAADIEEVVANQDKRRYELDEGRIRALYGHSVAAGLRREPSPPPELLYHGTRPSAADRILERGLRPMDRQYVHLSPDEATAIEVGGRRSDDPIVLTILAAEAAEAGVRFYPGTDEVWLADAIPAEFIRRGSAAD